MHQFAGAAARKPRKRHDFALAHGQIDVVEALAAEILQFQHRFAQFAGNVGFRIYILAADHIRGQRVGIGILYISGGNEFTVSQYRVAIRDFEDLRHLVRNEDEARSLCFQLLQYAEHMGDFTVGKRRGRLIQNQQLCVHMQGAADFQHLLFARFQIADHCGGIHIHAEVAEKPLRFFELFLFVDRAQRAA